MADAAAPMDKATARYAAFISYSHADSEMCDRLHKRLESYVIPHSLVGRQGPSGKIGKRLGKCFRDRVDLGAHHDLGAEIREALDQSAALIVLCSPQSAGSKYVEEEIRYFKSLGRVNQVFAVIIAGEPHATGKPGLSAADECFPRALIYRVGEDGALSGELEASEPIAADLRDKKDGVENGALKLIAGLLDIGLDDLVQREKKAEARRRRRAYAISAGMGVLALAAAAGGALAWVNGEKATEIARQLTVTNADLETNKQIIETRNRDLDRQLAENKALTNRITSVVGEMTTMAETDDSVPDRLLFLSYGAKLGMSSGALNIMFEAQGDDRYAVSNYSGRNFCVGYSYCDGEFSVEALRRDWAGALAGADIEKLAAVWGVPVFPNGPQSGTPAQREAALDKALAPLRDIPVTRRSAIRVFGRVQLPLIRDRLLGFWPDAEKLTPDCLAALTSIYVSQGGNAVKQLAERVADGTYKDVPQAIRGEGARRASGVQSERIAAIIRNRTEAQAALYESGLAGATAN